MTPALLPLLERVLPDASSSRARIALSEHLIGLTAAEADESLSDRARTHFLAKKAHAAALQRNDKPEARAWEAFLTAFRERWPAWQAGKAWGWEAVAQAIHSPDVGMLKELLALPGAPGAQELSSHLFPVLRFSKHESWGQEVALARALRLLDKEATSPKRLRVVSFLLESGADPSPTMAQEGISALAFTSHPQAARFLFQHGGRLDVEGVTSWLPEKAGKNLLEVQNRLKTWSQELSKPSSPHAGLTDNLQRGWPELMTGVARLLAKTTNTNAPIRLQIARQIRALGRHWKNDCWRAEGDQLSLAGEWSRHVLCRSAFGQVSQAYAPEAKLRSHPLDVFANGKEGVWSGVASDGRPAGAHGVLHHLLLDEPSKDALAWELCWETQGWSLEALGGAA